jgi:AraC family transcriptional regulator, transcriptional activator of pobA
LHQIQQNEKPLYHFSFLKDIKVYGIYYNSLASYLCLYPFLRKEHFHDFYSVLLFTKGEGTIRINNEVYPVHPQTICLIAPNQTHSFEDLGKAEGIVFTFCQDFYVEEFSFIRLLNVFSYTSSIETKVSNSCIHLSDSEYPRISEMMKSVSSEYESSTSDNNSTVIIRSLLNIMLIKFSELYEARSGKSDKVNSNLIHSLSNLVDSYFIQEQHVSFYTSALNISEKQLNDLCHRHFNCGLKKILQDRLMQETRKMLLCTELSVGEIAYKMNFEDNSYFNKVFKKEIGITPKSFRDMHKKIFSGRDH